MTVAQRIGLPPFLGWLTGESFLVTALYCLAITPFAMVVIALLLEHRWLPLTPSRQFLAFFPGDISLGLGVACLLMAAKDLPAERHLYNAPIVHIAVLIICAFVAYRMTRGELRNGTYPKMAILSPTKLYHNIVLYVGYGYVASTTFIADLGGLGWHELFEGGWMTRALIFIGAWIAIVVLEGMFYGKAGMAEKARQAHRPDWFYYWLVGYFAVKEVVSSSD